MFAMAGAAPPQFTPSAPRDGVFMLIGEKEIYDRMIMSENFKNIFIHSGETAWAAYYAGRESAFRDLLNLFQELVPPNN